MTVVIFMRRGMYQVFINARAVKATVKRVLKSPTIFKYCTLLLVHVIPLDCSSEQNMRSWIYNDTVCWQVWQLLDNFLVPPGGGRDYIQSCWSECYTGVHSQTSAQHSLFMVKNYTSDACMVNYWSCNQVIINYFSPYETVTHILWQELQNVKLWWAQDF